jgi:amino acid permease
MHWCGREGVACYAGEAVSARKSLPRAAQFHVRHISITSQKI